MTSFFLGSTFGHHHQSNAGAEIAAAQASGAASRAQSKVEQLETRAMLAGDPLSCSDLESLSVPDVTRVRGWSWQ